MKPSGCLHQSHSPPSRSTPICFCLSAKKEWMPGHLNPCNATAFGPKRGVPNQKGTDSGKLSAHPGSVFHRCFDGGCACGHTLCWGGVFLLLPTKTAAGQVHRCTWSGTTGSCRQITSITSISAVIKFQSLKISIENRLVGIAKNKST